MVLSVFMLALLQHGFAVCSVASQRRKNYGRKEENNGFMLSEM